jgi:putative transposase
MGHLLASETPTTTYRQGAVHPINWKAKYGGLDVSQLRRLKELEGENARLKKMFAELSLAHHALQDAVEKKL